MTARAQATAALAWRPEWPATVLILLAWGALIATPSWFGAAADPVVAHAHGVHSGAHAQATETAAGPAVTVAGWTLMSIAMMLSVALRPVRHVAVNSLRVRRIRAIGVFLAVYLAVWVVFGVAVLAVVRTLPGAAGDDQRWVAAGALGVAALWQLTRIKRRALFACRLTVPLALLGRKADIAVARYGLQHGRRCLIACWPLMAAMALVNQHTLLWMAGLTVVVFAEQLPLVGWRLLRPSAGVLAGAAGLAAVGI